MSSKGHNKYTNHVSIRVEKPDLLLEPGGVYLICKICELRKKEVINIKDGTRIGYASDVEIDLNSARITSIIIYGKLKLFGLLGRQKDILIKWENVDVIGKDTILVNFCQHLEIPCKKGILSNFFRKR